jgi:putative flippase GtrA
MAEILLTEAPRPERSVRLARLALVARHQLGAAIATAVDFATMTLLVQLAGTPPALAALSGASAGAIVNFHLGRRWIFRATSAPVAAQALRYALVSAGGALLNGAGELALHDGAHLDYLLARVVVSIVVSLGWNLPMQRRFVFGAEEARS